jgi:hypothetical protein
MKAEEIKRLLERYYDAETSEEEELILKEYFRGKNVPEIFAEEKAVFDYYDSLSAAGEPSPGFEQKIIDSISDSGPEVNFNRSKRTFLTLSGIAAGLLILAGSYFFLLRNGQPKDTFSDPKIAYAETMKILTNVSVKLNKGTQALSTIGKMQEMTSKTIEDLARPAAVIEENLKPLNKLNQAMEIVGSLPEQSTK